MNTIETRKVPADDPRALRRALRLLSSGQLVVFPTDTVYGVGAHAFQPEAVAALFTAKDRPSDRAIPVLVDRVEDVERVARDVPAVAWELISRFWPGGLTLVLPRAELVPPVLAAGGDTVAIRCPNHYVPLELMDALGAPLAATSANLSGQPSPTNARQVMNQLAGRVALVIDGGECPGGVPSTVVDLCTATPRLVRTGAVPVEKLCSLLPDLVR